jgi:hypothetical protein
VAVALLDTLPAPSINGVDRVYCQLRDILGIAVEQQTESSLQKRAEASVSSPICSKARLQRTAMDHPAAGTASSLAWAPSCLWSGHPSRRPEPPVCHQAHRGDEGARSEHCACNSHRGGRNDQERHNVSPEGPRPKVFGPTCATRVSLSVFKRPIMSSSTTEKTNPSVWLEDYRLSCRAGGVEDNLFSI